MKMKRLDERVFTAIQVWGLIFYTLRGIVQYFMNDRVFTQIIIMNIVSGFVVLVGAQCYKIWRRKQLNK